MGPDSIQLTITHVIHFFLFHLVSGERLLNTAHLHIHPRNQAWACRISTQTSRVHISFYISLVRGKKNNHLLAPIFQLKKKKKKKTKKNGLLTFPPSIPPWLGKLLTKSGVKSNPHWRNATLDRFKNVSKPQKNSKNLEHSDETFENFETSGLCFEIFKWPW